MTQANRGLQGVVENLIDTTHMQRESIEKLTTAIIAQSVEQAAVGSSIRELKGLARQTLAAIDGHLEVARTQALTVAELVAENRQQRAAHDERMAAITAVMERQQVAIDRLLAREGG